MSNKTFTAKGDYLMDYRDKKEQEDEIIRSYQKDEKLMILIQVLGQTIEAILQF